MQWSVLALGFFGDRVFEAIGVAEPPWLVAVREQKVVAIGGYFACNLLSQQLSSSGAFEVTFRGQSLWSALANGGRVPTTTWLARRLISDFGLEPAPEYAARLEAAD